MMDFCQIVRDIEKNPDAIVPIKTVRELLLLRAHVATCQECNDSVERTMRDSPPETGIRIGFN